jgi:hypothetical protein
LNGSAQPSLVVDGMNGEDLRGTVALWGYANEESYFSNVRITTAAAGAVKNGAGAAGEDLPVAGTWRDGYIELTFNGEGIATLAGWVEGDAGKGRMKVEGRAAT